MRRPRGRDAPPIRSTPTVRHRRHPRRAAGWRAGCQGPKRVEVAGGGADRVEVACGALVPDTRQLRRARFHYAPAARRRLLPRNPQPPPPKPAPTPPPAPRFTAREHGGAGGAEARGAEADGERRAGAWRGVAGRRGGTCSSGSLRRALRNMPLKPWAMLAVGRLADSAESSLRTCQHVREIGAMTMDGDRGSEVPSSKWSCQRRNVT